MSIIGSREILKMGNTNPIDHCLGPNCEGGRETVVLIEPEPNRNCFLYHVECHECGARGSGGASEEEAIENWNNLIANASTYICSKCRKPMNEDR